MSLGMGHHRHHSQAVIDIVEMPSGDPEMTFDHTVGPVTIAGLVKIFDCIGS